MPVPLTPEQLAALEGNSSSGSVTIEVPTQGTPEPNTNYFSQEQLDQAREEARKQEKDKLYSSIEKEKERVNALSSQLELFTKEKEESQRIIAEQKAAEDEARRKREEEELSARDLILRKEDEFEKKLASAQEEWNAKLERLQAERDEAASILEMEQQYQALNSYRARRLAEEQDNIMPDLVDLVTGNSEQEIEASISALVAKTSAIMENIQQSLPTQRVRGISPTGGAPVGPMDNTLEQRTLSLSDLKGLSMKEYETMRDRLLAQARPRR
jgi:DNA repair exonuclease SbcCD ATPase subunit